MAQYIPNDPLFQYEWYLLNTGQSGGIVGLDLNVTYVWPDYTGRGVKLAIYDDGVQYTHPDLAANYDASLSAIINGSPSDAHPLTPAEVGGTTGFNALNAHGTGMAGIAAMADNEEGGVGVAFGASIVGVYYPITGKGNSAPASSELVQAAQNLKNYDVTLMASGGGGSALNAGWTSFYTALNDAVTLGRDGLGTVMLNSVHNNGPGFGGFETNQNQVDSHRFMIHVGGVGDNGFVVPNATRSAAMLVSGFTGFQATAEPNGSPHNIIGTDLTGADGFLAGDYAQAGGTTSAVSQIAGVAALMLEANPDLGWRDVQTILSNSARHTGSAIGGPPNTMASETDSWEFNGADNWNGGGRHYSRDYGYGTVDALAAVRMAETWLIGAASAATSANEANRTASNAHGTVAIPDNTGGSVSIQFDITQDIRVENAQLRISLSHAREQDLKVTLISPDGTSSIIFNPVSAEAGSGNTSTGFRINSQEFRGESGIGTWTAIIEDLTTGNTGNLTGSSALVLSGSGNLTNDRYVYTDEFADYASLGTRNTLTDTDGGIDAINASAVTGNTTINLNAGSTSTIAGQSMTITPGSEIENAFTGDGNDTLVGNELNNLLFGGRGTNTIDGGDGDDTAAFLRGYASYSLQRVGGTIVVTGADSTDTLTAIEHLRFADITLDISNIFAPVISSNGGADTATVVVEENGTAVTTVVADDNDPGTTLTYAIVGGADAALFAIDATTGVLSFVSAPDFENPTDDDHNNSYIVEVSASDGTLNDTQTITVNVADVAETPPGVHWAGSPDLGVRAPSFQPAGIGDFDGDGTSDILWRNPTTGQLDQWRMENGNWAGSVDLGSHGPDWQVVGIGDFNNDGISDILWRNSTTGQVDQWRMENGNWAGSIDLGSHGLDWQVVGVGDFNNDGTSDILWRNSTTGQVDEWTMADGNWSGSIDLGSHGTDWQVTGVGDFNNDGTSDILWRNSTTGQVDEWTMADGNWSGSIDLGSHGTGWQVAGVGDFNADGTADLLWRNPTTGEMDGWVMQSGQWFSSISFGPFDPAYHVAGTGDFNHSGTGDVLWHNAATGQTSAWLLAST
jgi:subtilisin-like proprotein convertase family protein